MRCMVEEASPLQVEVVFPMESGPLVIRLSLPPGAAVVDACTRAARELGVPSEIWEDASCGVGIFGQKVAMTEPLRDGDRIECYRPIVCDAKALRRARAARR